MIHSLRQAVPSGVPETGAVLRVEPTLRATPPGRRGVRMTERPGLSVVLASWNERSILFACLETLIPECDALGIELLVVRSSSRSETALLTGSYPGVHFVQVPRGSPPPVLRSAGFAAASGDVVIFADDREVIGAGSVEQRIRPWLESRPEGSAIRAPTLSVIIAVRDQDHVLTAALDALAASDLPREEWELIVVDDASTDDSSLTAASAADTVLRLAGGPYGAAYAWNRGADASRGDILVFLHADTIVRPDTLSQLARALDTDPKATALFGTCDPNAYEPGVVSRYGNLLQAFRGHAASGAESFWAGCAAVRRDAFFDSGKFDEWHHTVARVADLEFGRRLRRGGHRVVPRQDILVRHARPWTMRELLGNDLTRRVIPTLWLYLHEARAGRRRRPPLPGIDLVAPLLLVGVAISVVAGLWSGASAWFGLSLALLIGALVRHGRFLIFAARHSGVLNTIALLPLHLAHTATVALAIVAGWVLRDLIGKPQPRADVEARAATGLALWPPAPSRPTASVWDLPTKTTRRRRATSRLLRRRAGHGMIS